ncbi:hypothetical protein Tsubulata_002740 [Turnera subulata]|uniref:PGG domain-containing protein n=1 Tax=Turnera subulata TaxID=218843 RepID=A0A9Q0GD36_9ROSI|nr:hypothetical protein Tsubulata_002740 [Turnera subulata]
MDQRLSDAILSGNTSALGSLLAEDPLLLNRISLISPMENPLHVSALAGQTEITSEILRRNPGLARELNQDGFSPLHIASANGHVEIVRELLKVGCDLCLLKGKDGKTALHCAAMKGRVGAVKELIAACPQSVKELTGFGETALHVAVKSNQVEVVRILMEEIMKLDMMEIIYWKDKDGNTLLHLATFRKQHEASEITIRLLIGEDAIAFGVDVNAINTSGFTPKDILDFILKIGGDGSDIYLLDVFQKAGALKSKEMAKDSTSRQGEVRNGSINGRPGLSSSLSWKLWKEFMKEIEDSSTDTQNALMVVAVLIATVTYQAILSPPSGFWSTESGRSRTINSVEKRDILPGEAVMAADHIVYAVFTVFNAVGFFASLGMISLLTSGFPLRAGLRLAILSMTATYIIAVVYTAPTQLKIVNIVVLMVTLLVLAEFARFMIWLLKKWGLLPIRRTGRSSTADEDQARV